MTLATGNTRRRRVARHAVSGAIILNVVTVVWAFHASAGSTVIAAIVLSLLGAAIGGSFGWATAPNRWGRWWAEGRTHRGPLRGKR